MNLFEPVLSREQTREVDVRASEEFSLPTIVLMENAGRQLADHLQRLLCAEPPEHRQRPVIICCGSGNNAGDGFVLARHLDARGYAVQIHLFSDPARLRGDAATNFQVLERSGISIQLHSASFDSESLSAQLATASWLVDGLLGTGARGEPRPPLDEVIRLMNATGRPILAIDLPSGLDCDTGQAADATIQARYTCTFVARKVGFTLRDGPRCVGELHVLDIGAPRALLESTFKAAQQ